MVLALNAPAAHDHGTVFRHLARQLAQRVGIDAADVGRPFGGFRYAVALAQQVGLELVEADGVGFQEVRVMQLLGQQRVGDADQHGAALGHKPASSGAAASAAAPVRKRRRLMVNGCWLLIALLP